MHVPGEWYPLLDALVIASAVAILLVPAYFTRRR